MTQGGGGEIEQVIGVLQFVFGQPAGISVTQQREVVEFVLKFASFREPVGERAKPGGRELMLLQFTEQTG